MRLFSISKKTVVILLVVLLLSAQPVLAFDRSELPSDFLDYTNEDYVNLLTYVFLPSLDAMLLYPNITRAQKNQIAQIRPRIVALINRYSAKDPDAYLNPFGRFGVKTKITEIRLDSGINGSVITVRDDEESKLVITGKMVLRDALLSDSYEVSIRFNNSALVKKTEYSYVDIYKFLLVYFEGISEKLGYSYDAMIISNLTKYLLANHSFTYDEHLRPPVNFCDLSDQIPEGPEDRSYVLDITRYAVNQAKWELAYNLASTTKTYLADLPDAYISGDILDPESYTDAIPVVEPHQCYYAGDFFVGINKPQ